MNKFNTITAGIAMALISSAAMAGDVDVDTSALIDGFLGGAPVSWQQTYTSTRSGILDGIALYGEGSATLTVHIDGAADSDGYYSGAWDATLGQVSLDGSPINLSSYHLNVRAGQRVTFEISDSVSLSSSAGSVGSMYINRHNPLDAGEDYTWHGDSLTFTSYVEAVPEPVGYGMLLAGLGLVGFAARRRRA